MFERQAAIKRLTKRSDHAGEIGNQADRALLEHADRRASMFYRCAMLMLWWGLVLGLAMWLCGCAHGPSVTRPGELRADAAERASQALKVEVLCVATTGQFGFSMGTGSGVIVSPTHALTAYHVVSCKDDGTPRIQVVTASGQKMVATVEVADRVGDVARIRLMSGLFPTADPPRVANVRTGMRVCAVSASPDRVELCGRVLAAATIMIDGGILHTIKSVKGNSGAGMYADDGSLVGIVVQRVPCPGSYEDSCGGRATSLGNRTSILP